MEGSISDPEGEQLSVAFLPYNTAKGTLVTNTDGSYTYTPAPNFPSFSGSDTARIYYRVTDPGLLNGGIDTIIITVSSPPANTAPVATDDLLNAGTGNGITDANQDLDIDVLANDFDADSNSLVVSLSAAGLKQPAHGSVQLVNGIVVYKPGFNYTGLDSFEYKLCDTFSAAQMGCSNVTSLCDVGLVTVQVNYITTPSIQIMGTVWNDVDGSANGSFAGIYNSGEIPANTGATLYVYLLDASGTVLEKSVVQTNGTYLISGAPAATSNLKLLLTTADVAVGSTQPTTALPTGWAATSPLINPSVTTAGLYLIGKDFGIEQVPTAGGGTHLMQNPWGTAQAIVPGSSFASTSASSDVAPGTISGILITAVPTGATSISINGTIYGTGFTAFPAAGVLVPATSSGQPLQTISVDPAVNTVTTVDIPFKAVDNAGKSSLNTGHVVVTLFDPTISGSVYDDANGATNNSINGTLISALGAQALYVNLLNTSGQVLGTVPVTAGGYTLTQGQGVSAGVTFSVVLSTIAGQVGTTNGATPVMPISWVNTAEGTGAGDGTPNGIVSVIPGTTNTVANFGVDQLPTASNTTAPRQLNPGGTKTAVIPASVFVATDQEDGSYNSGLGGKMVKLYPGVNGNLFYNNVLVSVPLIINSFSGSKLTIDPTGPDSTGWVAQVCTFNYSVFDNADMPSLPATVTLPFDSALCINLRVYLEGALINNGGATASDGRPLMRDGLRNSPFTGINIIPPLDPYTTSTAYVNVTGKNRNLPPQTTYSQYQAVTDSATVFSVTGQNAIVDWVYIELRSNANNKTILGCRSALLQRDGDVVEVSGNGCVKFPDVPIDSYFVSIEHRTHFGTLTKFPQKPSVLQSLVDFTIPSLALWDKGVSGSFNFTGLSQKPNVVGTYRAMWQGDFNGDGKIRYDSPSDDLSVLPFDVKNHPKNSKQTTNLDIGYGYRQADFDMNGKVKFDNPNDDNAMLLFQVRRYPLNTNHTTNFDNFLEQLP